MYLLAYAGVITFSVRVVRHHPRRYWSLAPLSGLVILGGGWFAIHPGNDTALIGMIASTGALQFALMVPLLRAFMDPPPSANGVDLLLVGVCGFLLLGGVFGAMAGLQELSSPGSFSDPTTTVSPLPWQSLLYGSLVTLSAIGCGDVTPVSSWARSLFALEGVIGVLFVAIVISQLVSAANEARDSSLRQRSRRDV